MQRKSINIDFRSNDRVERELSNLSQHDFIFDSVKCASMEGLLQSLKFKDINVQQEVCSLYGFKAKFRGKGIKWFEDQILWWRGVPFDRHSNQYQELLDLAYLSLFTQNIDAKEILLSTGDVTLTHHVGTTNPYRTILTKNEFCNKLMCVRKQIEVENGLDF